MCAASLWSKRSRTTARLTTMPAQPPSACRKRKPISASIDQASAQPIEAAVYSARPN
jgi:hypothetical protein